MTVVEQMLQRYALNTHEDRSYALREVIVNGCWFPFKSGVDRVPVAVTGAPDFN